MAHENSDLFGVFRQTDKAKAEAACDSINKIAGAKARVGGKDVIIDIDQANSKSIIEEVNMLAATEGWPVQWLNVVPKG